jgi:hypothetical protein
MPKRKKLTLVGAIVLVTLLALFFATAQYGDDHQGVRFINRPPFANIEWGPSWRFIVQEGVNVVPDPGRLGMPGNVMEFSISRHTRVSVRLVSFHWINQEFRAWQSTHPRIAEWINPCPPRPDCRRLAGQ